MVTITAQNRYLHSIKNVHLWMPLRAVVAKNRAEKSDLLRSSSFIAILKALFNLSMLEKFQSDRMIQVIFIGLERSMMDFFGEKKIILVFFSLNSTNNVRLTSKL